MKGVHNLYSSSNIIRIVRSKKDKMSRIFSTHEEKMHARFW